MKTVRKLADDIGIRERAMANERRAALFIARKFESYGYSVRLQKFSVDGGTSRNVVARWPRSVEHPLVIGGHIDSVHDSPGANDNASGVATILEAARLAAGKRQVKYIKWVAFGAEEYGDSGTHHDGSQVYVDKLGPEGRKARAGCDFGGHDRRRQAASDWELRHRSPRPRAHGLPPSQEEQRRRDRLPDSVRLFR